MAPESSRIARAFQPGAECDAEVFKMLMGQVGDCSGARLVPGEHRKCQAAPPGPITT